MQHINVCVGGSNPTPTHIALEVHTQTCISHNNLLWLCFASVYDMSYTRVSGSGVALEFKIWLLLFWVYYFTSGTGLWIVCELSIGKLFLTFAACSHSYSPFFQQLIQLGLHSVACLLYEPSISALFSYQTGDYITRFHRARVSF